MASTTRRAKPSVERLGEARTRADLSRLNREGLGEVALVGRSNAGKSSLVNALLALAGAGAGAGVGATATKTKMANASKRPGTTRAAQMYRMGSAVVVDLPGYGFATGPRDEAKEMADVVHMCVLDPGERPTLRRVLVLVDARRGAIQPADAEMLRALEAVGVAYDVVLTKIDALSRLEALAAPTKIRESMLLNVLGGVAPFSLFPTSSKTGEGVAAVRRHIVSLCSLDPASGGGEGVGAVPVPKKRGAERFIDLDVGVTPAKPPRR